MHNIIILVCVIGAGITFAIWDIIAPPNGIISTHQHTTKTLKHAPNPTFIDIKGNNYSLHQFKGKTIILNFWATWCTPCIIEMPQLLELAQREQDNIIFIALSVDDNPIFVSKFLKHLPQDVKKKLKLKNVIFGLDTDKSISKGMFETVMYPETYIIDSNMVIKHKIKGVTDWLGIDMMRILKTN